MDSGVVQQRYINQILEAEEEQTIVTVSDGYGREFDCFLFASVLLHEEQYVLFLPVESTEDETVTMYIFHCEHTEDGVVYLAIEDDAIYQAACARADALIERKRREYEAQ